MTQSTESRFTGHLRRCSVAGASRCGVYIRLSVYRLAANWRHTCMQSFCPTERKKKKIGKLEPVVELEKNLSRVQARQYRLPRFEPPVFALANSFQELGYSADSPGKKPLKWLPKSSTRGRSRSRRSTSSSPRPPLLPSTPASGRSCSRTTTSVSNHSFLVFSALEKRNCSAQLSAAMMPKWQGSEEEKGTRRKKKIRYLDSSLALTSFLLFFSPCANRPLHPHSQWLCALEA